MSVCNDEQRVKQESVPGPGKSTCSIFKPTVKTSVQYVWLENRLADFHLWADGVGAMAKDRASLDHRFESYGSEFLPVRTLLLILRSDLEEFCVEARNEIGLSISAILDDLAMAGVVIRRTGRSSRLQKYDNKFDPSRHVELERFLRFSCVKSPACASGSNVGAKLSVQDYMNCLAAMTLTPAQERVIQSNLRRRSRFMLSYHHSKGLESRKTASSSRNSRQMSQDRNMESIGSSDGAQPPLQSSQQRSTSGVSSKLGNERPTESRPSTTASLPVSQIQNKDIVEMVSSKRPSTSITTITGSAKYPKPPKPDNSSAVLKCPACFQTLPQELGRNKTLWK